MNSTPARKFLVLGGARSGKSSCALRLADGLGRNPLFVATAEAIDPEMVARIKAHRKARGPHWACAETPLEIARLISGAGRNYPVRDVLLIDCLTVWLNNVLFKEGEKSFRRRRDELLEAIRRSPRRLVIVSNEVGLGIVPDNALARQFRDLAGWLNQDVARAVDTVVFVAAGLPLVLKGKLPEEERHRGAKGLARQ